MLYLYHRAVTNTVVRLAFFIEKIFKERNHRQITRFGNETGHFALTFQKVMFYEPTSLD